MADPTAVIPPELFARLARPTVRLSGSIDEAAAASFLSQVLPTLDVPGSIVVELFSSGGEAEVGRRLAQEVRLLRQAHGRDMRFLGKTLVASAAVTFMAAFPRDREVRPHLDAARFLDVHLQGPGFADSPLEEDGFEPPVPLGSNTSVSTGFASWRGGRSLFRKAPRLRGDRQFESGSLQRRVTCEPDFGVISQNLHRSSGPLADRADRRRVTSAARGTDRSDRARWPPPEAPALDFRRSGRRLS